MLTTEELKKYGNIVFDNYLSKPYADQNISMDWALSKDGMLPPGHISIPDRSNDNVINRPNHGLAHTLRVVSYVPMVINTLINNTKGKKKEAYKKLKNDIKKIQIVSFFHIVGRVNDGGVFVHNTKNFCEMYKTGKKNSCEAFEEKAKDLGIFSTEEIGYYKEQMLNSGSRNMSDDAHLAHVFYISHNMDLFRCYSEYQMEERKDVASKYVGKEFATKLFAHSLNCIENTGDRVLDGDKAKDYNKEVFFQASIDAAYCLDKITEVESALKKRIEVELELKNQDLSKQEINQGYDAADDGYNLSKKLHENLKKKQNTENHNISGNNTQKNQQSTNSLKFN
jgi:hypothetical protein